jgi:ABC-type glycerol-3-phosphate transport system substrate-binding protein
MKIIRSLILIATACSVAGYTGFQARAGAQATVVYWSMFSEGEPLQQVLKTATDDFIKENPGIKIETKWAGRQVLTQLQSALAAKVPVDVVDHSDDRVFNAIVKGGQALPMDKYLNEKAYDSSKTWRETFQPGVLDQMKKDGNVYLIPRDDYISAFFYNAKMFNDNGIQPPGTWSAFLAALDKMKAKGIAPLGADATVSFYNNWYFTYTAIRMAGVDAFRQAAYDKTGEKWSDPKFLEAAKMVALLRDKGYFQKGYESSVWPAAQVLWVNSKIGMMFMGAWLPTEMSQQTPKDFQIGMFRFPDVAGGAGNGIVEHWANVYGVLKDAKYPDAVAQYLKYITSIKIAKRITALGTPVPVVGAPVPPSLENQFKIMASTKLIQARAGLNTEIPDYMERVFNKCTGDELLGKATPDQMVGCLKSEGKAYWANK